MKPAPLITVLTLLFCTNSIAHAYLLTNGSFEEGNFINHRDNFMILSNGSTTITGWTVISDYLGWGNNSTPVGIRASDGFYFLDLTGGDDTVPHGGISQTFTTTVDQLYSVSFDLGTYQTNPNWGGPVSVLATTESTSIPFTFNPTGTGNQWGNFSFIFRAGSSSSNVSFLGLSAVTESYIGLDNVRVSAVPIPAAIWLFGSSLVGLALVRRRKRRLC